jgi:sec-independent protein translocase protein TatA
MGLDNPLHIAFLVVILLLVFGARRLPEIGRSLGSGMREFKESITGESKPHSPTLPAGEQPAQPFQQQPQPPAQAPQQPAQPQQPQPPAQAPAAQPPEAQPASVAGSDQSAPPGTQTPGSA